MQKPLVITFRGVPRTKGIEDIIRGKVAKLEQVCSYIISCSVAVEKPQLHQKKGNPFRVRIDLRVPHNHEIIVERKCTEGSMHDPLPKIVRRAFDAAGLALQNLVQIQRGRFRVHSA